MTIQWKKPTNGAPADPDRPTKDQLVGSLIAITGGDYDPAFDTSYGEQPMAEFDLVVIDGEFAGYTEDARREFGNLAKQIGAALNRGELGLGRIESGTGNKGRTWFGIKWAEEPGDFAAAEKALSGTKSKAPF